MATTEDPASVLEYFVNDVANLPAEITHLYEEIEAKDKLLQECKSIINSRDASLQKFIKLHSSLVKNPKEEQYEALIMSNYDKAMVLQEEKIRLSEKAAVLLDRHVKRLDLKLRDLSTDTSIPLDPNLPSLLRDSPNYVGPAASSVNTGTNTPLNPLSGNTAGGAASLSHAAIARISSVAAGGRVSSPALASVQQNHLGNGPVQATAAMSRSSREMSVGSETKRRRLHASLGALPTPSSSLARQSSLGPGTPKVQTPGSRAGSAGPRPMKKVMRKLPPQQQLRKKIGMRSEIKKSRSRVPGTNRASPSTTADDESVLSGEGTEDENVSGGGLEGAGDGDAEGDEDIEDNTKYCICQRVSHGDMVACDFPDCPYQWFHWTCVGISEEPVGEWYCEHCRPLVQQKKQKKK